MTGWLVETVFGYEKLERTLETVLSRIVLFNRRELKITLAMQIIVFILVLTHALYAYASEVVVLDSKNFEHLTQASTGATTGDWLIKFYAPWSVHPTSLSVLIPSHSIYL